MRGRSCMGELPTDVITKIFLKLPVKPIFRFRCVSKTWNKLISDRWFVNSHRKLFVKDHLLFTSSQPKIYVGKKPEKYLHHDQLWTMQLSLTNVKGEKIADLLYDYGGCDRVFCAGCDLVCIANHDYIGYILLCNPTTQEFRFLPHGTGDHTMCLGFGYLTSTKEYIVVRLFQPLDGNFTFVGLGCEMITFGDQENTSKFHTSSWKRAKENRPYIISAEGLLFNRSMYWIVYSGDHVGLLADDDEDDEQHDHEEDNDEDTDAQDQHDEEDHLDNDEVVDAQEYYGDEDDKKLIISFDIDTETFLTIDCPPGTSEKGGYERRFAVLMDLKGRNLCMTNLNPNLILDMWVLKDKERSLWEKEYSIEFDVKFRYMKGIDHMCPMYTSDGEIVFGTKYNTFYFYNIEMRCFRELKGPKGLCRKIGLFRESLFVIDEESERLII